MRNIILIQEVIDSIDGFAKCELAYLVSRLAPTNKSGTDRPMPAELLH